MSRSDLGPPDCRSWESPTLKPGKPESSPGGLRGLGPCGFWIRKGGHHSPKSFSSLVLTSSKHLQITWFLSPHPQRQHRVMQLQSEPVQGLTQARGWSVRQDSFALGGRKGKKSEGVTSRPQKPRVLVPVESQACVWPWAGPQSLPPPLAWEGKGSKDPSHRDILAFHSPDAADFPASLLDVRGGCILRSPSI